MTKKSVIPSSSPSSRTRTSVAFLSTAAEAAASASSRGWEVSTVLSAPALLLGRCSTGWYRRAAPTAGSPALAAHAAARGPRIGEDPGGEAAAGGAVQAVLARVLLDGLRDQVAHRAALREALPHVGRGDRQGRHVQHDETVAQPQRLEGLE